MISTGAMVKFGKVSVYTHYSVAEKRGLFKPGKIVAITKARVIVGIGVIVTQGGVSE
jgi:hypothetical protein